MLPNRMVYLFILIACLGCTAREGKTEAAESNTPAIKSNPETPEQRQQRLAQVRQRIDAERKAAQEKLIATSPFYTTPTGKLVYHKAEVDPAFTGGEAALNTFLKENLRFPSEAQDEGLEGTVFVDFVVDASGRVTEATATSHTYDQANPLFVDEALRVVNLMPTWTPGRQNGRNVDVKYSLPITFNLQ